MRRIALIFLLALAWPAIARAQQFQQQFVINDDVEWDGPGNEAVIINGQVVYRNRAFRGLFTDAQIRQQIQQVIQVPHDFQKGDAWAWRDSVETSLVSLGPRALPMLRTEMESREGYELDALQVAAFRIENAPLNPRESLLQWAEKRYGAPSAEKASPFKITRILNIGGGSGGSEVGDLFPHHLFYVLEFVPQHKRTVLALAADAKIQPLDNDDALAAFIRVEAEPQHSEACRLRLTTTTAFLALARASTIYKPENQRTEIQPGPPPTFKTTLDVLGAHQTAMITFTATGGLQSLTTSQESNQMPKSAPISVPAPTAPPPPIPE